RITCHAWYLQKTWGAKHKMPLRFYAWYLIVILTQNVFSVSLLSYVTEEQRRAGQNLARAARSVKSQQALSF
ncbi:MAG: hypothetical protein RIC19_23425, partial [Phaeodactylibacter sp.]|uniref:hypothetical protein n=1 Tax=Phaeodactylibacter sp. TaxID=1940289 RepID=UPI0032EA912A